MRKRTMLMCALLIFVNDGTSFSQRKFLQAVDARDFIFPRDHGRHDEFQTEWWYITGNVKNPQGREFGYQLTFFRRAVTPEINARRSAWAFRDLYASHFAISDISTKRFDYDQRLARGALGIAHVATDSLGAHLQSWSMRQEQENIILHAVADFGAIDLVLRSDAAPALHGQNGLAKKGSQAGQASYYYSLPHLPTSGMLKVGGEEFAITGVSWMDHEFGSNQLPPEDAGWDWFALHFPDRVEVMLYLLRRRDGSFAPYSAGSLMRDGRVVRHLDADDFIAKPVKWWTSPHSGARYPVAWEVEVDDYKLKIDAAFENQELDTRNTTGVIYWEGPVQVSGERNGKQVNGAGYLEMTGYAPHAAPVF